MLNINEIFRSIEGEVCGISGQGSLTTFIRLQGCNLSSPFCSYCDTKHAQDPSIIKNELSVENILKIIPKGKVTITGGEPLLQKNKVIFLIMALLDKGHKISVETNGSILIPKIFENNSQLSWIIDYKLSIPHKICLDNFWNATSQDWIKFVIEDEITLQTAIDVSQALISGGCKARIAFSPVMKNNNGEQAQWLADQIIEKELWGITLNLQIHKLIWSDKSEGISLL